MSESPKEKHIQESLRWEVNIDQQQAYRNISSGNQPCSRCGRHVKVYSMDHNMRCPKCAKKT